MASAAIEDRFRATLTDATDPACYVARALVHAMQGDIGGAIALSEQRAKMARDGGRDVWIGGALTGLAACEWFLPDPATVDHASQALAHLERCGSSARLAAALLQVARAGLLIGNSDVRAFLERSVDVGDEIAHALPVPYAHAHLGELDLATGNVARGFDHFRQAIVALYRARDIADLGFCLMIFAHALVARASLTDVVLLHEGVKRIAPHWLAVPINAHIAATLTEAEASLSADLLHELRMAAAHRQLDELVDHALLICDQG